MDGTMAIYGAIAARNHPRGMLAVRTLNGRGSAFGGDGGAAGGGAPPAGGRLPRLRIECSSCVHLYWPSCALQELVMYSSGI